MKTPTDTLKRAILIVQDLTESELAPHEQMNVLDLAMRTLATVHWQPQQPPQAPEQPLRSKNVQKN